MLGGEESAEQVEPEYVRAESHGDDPTRHLEDCRRLAKQGYRPVSITASSNDRGATLVASVWRRPKLSPKERDRLAFRQVNAAITLLLIEKGDLVWPHLQLGADGDPTVRSRIIHRLAMEQSTSGRIWARFQELNRGSERAASSGAVKTNKVLIDPQNSERLRVDPGDRRVRRRRSCPIEMRSSIS